MSHFQKIKIKFFLGLFIFATVLSSVVFGVQQARAQAVNVVADAPFTAWDMRTLLKEQQKETMDEMEKNKNFMVMNAVINAMGYFANKISYDMAVWLASGNLGQGPFAHTGGFSSYLAQVAGDSLGEALGSLRLSLGLNICDLPDLRLDLALQIGLHFAYEPPTPKCTWQQLREAYNPENIRSKYASREGLSNRLSANVAVKDSDFGIWYGAKASIDSHAAEQRDSAQLDRQEGSGFKAMTNLISGNITTPADAMKEQFKGQTLESQQQKREAANSAQVWGAFGAGATQVAYQAASTFINTLLGTMLKNFMEKGMLPGGYKVCNPGLRITGINLDDCVREDSGTLAESFYSAGGAGDNRRAAQEMFAELLTPQMKTLDNYNLIATMALCDESNRSPDTCVVDQSFLQILQAADSGEMLSVKQAMEKGWLHGDWLLVSPENLEQNDKWNCATEAYCVRNLKFLRMARILPVGFEIAASKIGKDAKITLKQVVDGFFDKKSPFYHLINPSWVIKLPKLRCKAYVYGTVAQNGARVQECADIQHCVGYNKDGSCQTWGYCMKERPIWKINADYCDAEFATCRSFTNGDGDNASYLTRTLDTISCNAENDGCRRFSNAKFFLSATNSLWLPPFALSAPTVGTGGLFVNTSLNLNNKAATCDAKDDGCSAFKLASDPAISIYLKKAPDDLLCYDADPQSSSNQLLDVSNRLSNGIQWPKNVTDLGLLRPQNSTECKKYAQVCLPEEEKCNFYNSLLTGDTIPGKFKPAQLTDGQIVWNDQCSAKCNGYATYREMPSNYSNGQSLSYIIPSSGQTCAPVDAGCTGFSNLNATQGGLEQNEYFSYLRLCILPDQNKQKNFYVYESSEKSGYQLKTYTLEKNSLGGPKQIYRDAEEMVKYTTAGNAYCSQQSYLAKTAEPDCHQFNDDAGVSYYAMLSKTVLVSDQCTPYRLNNTELTQYNAELRCPYDFSNDASQQNKTGNAVELKEGACYYMGFTGNTNGAGDSKTCSKDVDSCRAYKGNAGNNIRTIVNENFETANTTGGWTGWDVNNNNKNSVIVAQSTESTQLSGHSLRVTLSYSGVVTNRGIQLTVPLTKDKSYVISFWAKGNVKIDEVYLSGSSDLTLADNIQTGDVWRYYTYGPVEFTGETAAQGILGFEFSPPSSASQGTRSLFLDNIKLSEVTDYIYLVKNTLSVDPICDSNLNDNLPGEALGCTAYKDPAKNTFYLTNFSYLCREEAVGCTAVLDTFNTPDDPLARAYNVWLAGVGGTKAEVVVGGTAFSCQIPSGSNGCYTNIAGKTAKEIFASADAIAGKIAFTSSSIYIPPDTAATAPIYLVANKDATCKAENMGCQVMGRSTLTPVSAVSELQGNSATFEDIAVKNDPALYDSMLCTYEGVGCRSWESGDSNYYFKDPKLNGNKICSYHSEPVEMSLPVVDPGNPPALLPHWDVVTVTTTGWLWKDVGMCGNIPGLLCSSDNDCPKPGICQLKNQIPCYPLTRDSSGGFALWSFGNTNYYEGFVGECPQEQSGCSEFVDHSSVADNKLTKKCKFSGKMCYKDSDCNEAENDICQENIGSAYYLIENNKLKEAENKCNGLVSEAEGCVLLDKTAQPNKYWHTTSTYADSIKKNDKMVAPQDKGAQNDANTILKVTHDRECAEWAYCDFANIFTDQVTGEVTSKCYSLGVCQKASGALGASQAQQCANPLGTWEGKGQLFTSDYYTGREVEWGSLDYSGYTVPFRYQTPDLKVRTIMGVNRLVYVETSDMRSAVKTECPLESGGGFSFDKELDKACGVNGTGRCLAGECLYHISGSFSETPMTSPRLSCRGFPEATSPYPQSVLNSGIMLDFGGGGSQSFKEGFEGVNLCYDTTGKLTNSCDCSYSKLETNSGNTYAPTGGVSRAVCVGGSKPGASCTYSQEFSEGVTSLLDKGCDKESGGVCSLVKTVGIMSGWSGYCMGYDERQHINGALDAHRCLTWWPLELPPGSSNVWSFDPRASYEPGIKKDKYVCTENLPALTYSAGGNSGFIFGDSEALPDILGEHKEFISGYYTGSNSDIFIPSFEDTILKSTNNSRASSVRSNPGTTLRDGPFVNVTIPENSLAFGCGLMGLESKSKLKATFCPLKNDQTDSTGSNDKTAVHTWGEVRDPESVLLQDIAQIDVILDGAGNIPSRGYVSFYNKIVIDSVDGLPPSAPPYDGGEYGAFDVVANLNENKGTPFDSREADPPHQDGEYYYWDWWATANDVDVSAGSFFQDENFITQIYNTTYESFVGGGSNYGIAGAEMTGANLTAIRIVWKKDSSSGNWYFKGIMVIAEDSTSDESSSMGDFYIIHFTPGQCRNLAQVQDEGADGNSLKFNTKPYTGRLQTAVNLEEAIHKNGAPTKEGSNVITSRDFVRRSDFAQVGFGRAIDDGAGAPLGLNALFTNPFSWPVSNDDGEPYGNYGVRPTLTYKNPSYQGGVPLYSGAYMSNSGKMSSYYLAKRVTQGGWPNASGGTTAKCNVADILADKGNYGGAEDYGGDVTEEARYYYCAMLSMMYAKVYGNYEYNASKEGYASLVADSVVDISHPTIAAAVGANIYPPRVAAPVEGSEKNEFILNAIAVRGKTGANVYVPSGESVNINFYAWAFPNQMPLRRIVISKDPLVTDKIFTIEGDSLGNKKPMCGSSLCVDGSGNYDYAKLSSCTETKNCNGFGSGWKCGASRSDYLIFGSTEETGCHAEPVEFMIDFTCDVNTETQYPGVVYKWNDLDPIDQQTVLATWGQKDYVCIYKPRVQVMDNWGWCTGSCYANTGAVKGSGCWNGFGQSEGGDQCLTTKSNPWISYGGKIIVVPTE
ncbi:MAG: carbohydrate binding domain-containing protein [Patescibacteria group bacterium]|nr:carbohydrate binding domain-containing protein [Patescibacteria group bacterium]